MPERQLRGGDRLRRNRHHRTIRLAQNLLGNGTEHEPLEASAAMRAITIRSAPDAADLRIQAAGSLSPMTMSLTRPAAHAPDNHVCTWSFNSRSAAPTNSGAPPTRAAIDP